MAKVVMKPFTVLVVDDEKPARANILRLLEHDRRFRVVGEARDGIEALEQLDAAPPDLVFLDIQMPGISGFEVLDAFGSVRSFEVVFSTAYDQYALRAFEAHAIDYLLKPYDLPRFQKTLQRAYTLCCGSGHTSESLLETARSVLPEKRSRLTLRSSDGAWVTMAVSDVRYLLAGKRTTRIFLRDSEHVVGVSLGELYLKLDERFIRTHRSEVVNVDAVRRVEPWSHGDAILELDNGATRVLTRTYRTEFMTRYLARSGPR